MIRFAPKIQQNAAAAIKKPSGNTRPGIGLSDTSVAAAENEAGKMEGLAATAVSGSVGPAAKLLELSGELPSKGRKTGSRKRKEVARPEQLDVGNRGHEGVGDLLLDL
ncbi:hypothetical protein FHT78_004150 [Rhizobium sp. BK196]|jgi:hypothetical protein|uniref:hypothetical protein n=1 Tax=unclassified Rhizobium TaxID=2613769 RepID=UPI00161E9FDB|nr:MULTISPECIES: hypothetical protein [unclassified Rhizobium]MBB3312368.1 hypothetical protein [Rhizobium sp. BK196]MBB3463177.1 hypothetical protein [Rhizobium sp. BK377]